MGYIKMVISAVVKTYTRLRIMVNTLVKCVVRELEEIQFVVMEVRYGYTRRVVVSKVIPKMIQITGVKDVS